jgi:hypothetical protein
VGLRSARAASGGGGWRGGAGLGGRTCRALAATELQCTRHAGYALTRRRVDPRPPRPRGSVRKPGGGSRPGGRRARRSLQRKNTRSGCLSELRRRWPPGARALGILFKRAGRAAGLTGAGLGPVRAGNVGGRCETAYDACGDAAERPSHVGEALHLAG